MVFDNDIGSGSVSPLIVTGGKNGDVGLHDFRYIATGKTKRHRHHDGVETNINTSSSADNGMLWYIPKAHLGTCFSFCPPNQSDLLEYDLILI